MKGIICQANKRRYLKSHTKEHLFDKLITKQVVEVENVKHIPGEWVILRVYSSTGVITLGQCPDLFSLGSRNEPERSLTNPPPGSVGSAQEAKGCTGLRQYGFQPGLSSTSEMGSFVTTSPFSDFSWGCDNRSPEQNGGLWKMDGEWTESLRETETEASQQGLEDVGSTWEMRNTSILTERKENAVRAGCKS